MKKIKCIVGFHDYVRLDNDSTPKIPKDGAVIMVRKHKCSRCGKEKMIGSGLIT